MKRITQIRESELVNLIQRVINESQLLLEEMTCGEKFHACSEALKEIIWATSPFEEEQTKRWQYHHAMKKSCSKKYHACVKARDGSTTVYDGGLEPETHIAGLKSNNIQQLRLKESETTSKLKFNKQSRKKGAKTDIYNVVKGGTTIGQVKWYSRLRGYGFLPPSGDESEVTEFVKEISKTHRENNKKNKK